METFSIPNSKYCWNRLITTIFVTSLLLNCCHGFFPNQYSPLLKGGDYTHADITQIGILKAVAGYFETVAAPGQATVVPTGNLTGITDITARKLYDAYYGESVSEGRFQEAIDDIIKYNNMVDQDHYTEAAWHFNGERIAEGNTKLKSLRDTALNILNAASPDYEAARSTIGSYLHILQMFYSNTNWVEMKGGTISQDLGKTSFSQTLASPTTDTCMSCGLTIMPPLPCFINLLPAARTQLTSGYKGGQDVAKPFKDPATNKNGKCSHGGPTDRDTNSSAALGGINKDTTNSSLSPHFGMHKRAGGAAIEHTTYFFTDPSYGLLNRIGKDKFEQLLHLKPGKSLVFVIDSSGSMSADIAVITQKTRELVTQTQNTANKPFNYILVTFSDPENKTKTQQSTNANDILTWLGQITPTGGSDCPEFSLSGIQAASVAANQNSQIYVFTDATPKDPEKRQFIQSLSNDKNLRIDFVITGSCDRKQTQYRQRRSADPFNDIKVRYQRHANEQAAENKEHNFVVSDDNDKEEAESELLSTYVLVIKRHMDQSRSTIAHIPVDSTMSELFIKIKGKGTMPSPKIQKPDGKYLSLMDHNVLVEQNGGYTLDVKVNLTNVLPGIWEITKVDKGEWNLEVYGTSLLNFQASLVFPPESNVTTHPAPGDTHDVSVEINPSYAYKAVFHLYLDDHNGEILTSSLLTHNSTDPKHRSFSTKVFIPWQSYQFAVDGTDSNGFIFHRMMKNVNVYVGKRSANSIRHRRVRRSTTTSWNGMDVYQLISQQSGGHVYETTKANIGQTVDYIKSSITASHVTILRYSSRGGTTGCNSFVIPIDVTCRKFSLIIKADRGMPDPALSKPGSSTPVAIGSGGVTKTTLGGTYMVLTVDNPTPGTWSVRKNDLYHWQMEVTAESKVDFTSKFLELGPDGFSLFPIKRKPTAGTNHTVSITMNDMSELDTVSDVVMLNMEGEEIAHYALQGKTGQYARNIFTTEVTVPSESFQTAIDGTDSAGNDFRRMHPGLVNTVALELEIMPITEKLYVDEKLEIPYTVANTGEGSITVEVAITDDKGFSLAPKTNILKLTDGENVTSHFTLKAGKTAGETTTITLSAEPIGAVGSLKYDIIKLKTEARLTPKQDNIPPHCDITSVTNYCSIDDCTCATAYTATDMEIWDEGFGLAKIDASGHGNGILLHTNFSVNQTKVDRIVKPTLITDCCRNFAYVNIVDSAGQKGNCTIDINPHYNNSCTTTTTTTTPMTTTSTLTTSTTASTTPTTTTATTTPSTTTTSSTTPTSTTSSTTTATTSTTTPSTTSTSSTTTSTTPTTTLSISTKSSTTVPGSTTPTPSPSACVCPTITSSVAAAGLASSSASSVSSSSSSAGSASSTQAGAGSTKPSALGSTAAAQASSATDSNSKEASTGEMVGIAVGVGVAGTGVIVAATYLIKKKFSAVSPD